MGTSTPEAAHQEGHHRVGRHACSTHSVYRLSCEDFDKLRASPGCWICDKPGPLNIDHDHTLGLAAVRGLVCHRCNTRLGKIDAGLVAPTGDDLAYLLGAWHLTREIPVVPDQRVPVRNVRVHLDAWNAALAKARNNGETLTSVVHRALEGYVAKD